MIRDEKLQHVWITHCVVWASEEQAWVPWVAYRCSCLRIILNLCHTSCAGKLPHLGNSLVVVRLPDAHWFRKKCMPWQTIRTQVSTETMWLLGILSSVLNVDELSIITIKCKCKCGNRWRSRRNIYGSYDSYDMRLIGTDILNHHEGDSVANQGCY